MYCQKVRNSSSFWCMQRVKEFLSCQKRTQIKPWFDVHEKLSGLSHRCLDARRLEAVICTIAIIPSPPTLLSGNNGRNVESTECTPPWFVYLHSIFLLPLSVSDQINTAGLMGKTWREEGINRFCRGTKGLSPNWNGEGQGESSAEQSIEALLRVVCCSVWAMT